LKEFDGSVVAGDAEGAKERLAVFDAAGGGPGFEEHGYCFGLAGAAEGESSFFGHLIGGGEELANEGEGVAAFDGEEGFEHLSGDSGLGVAGAGLQAKQQGAIVALHFGEGVGGIGADGGRWFGQGVDYVTEDLLARKVGAGGEGEQTDAAKGAGGVLLAAPRGLHLNVRGSAEKGGRFAMAEVSERAGDGVLAPTLRIAFDGMIEGAQDSGSMSWADRSATVWYRLRRYVRA
jgi:hypothetical protein